ncbi:serine hydrolase domain-containing protein [Pseudonocardia asaccharolytica]|nr:serine hydrolase domain-containing protein [Pseudonocardia asaccharolytica]
MTQRGGPVAATSLERVWRVPDAQVAAGRIPGYVAAVRLGGRVQVRAGGRTAIETRSAPMREETLFRIASLTKPMGGALTLGLVRDGALALDDPIARWLPEAANPRVLVAPGAPLDRTTEATRPITVRHLLTMTCGWGAVLEETPLQAAMMRRGVYPGPLPPRMSGDEFVARVADLPMAFQPGEGWLYDTGIDLLGVLLSRATGQPLSDLLAERVTGPLGMTSTSFGTPHTDRLATAYQPGSDGLELLDPPDGAFAGPSAFEQLGSGLVSTAPDVLRFFCAMADGGGPVLGADSVALMTADALTGDQRRQALPIVGPGGSWGLATAVDVEAADPWMAPGRWGWDGGTGTTARVDPERGTVGVLLTQRAMTGAQDGFDEFWAAVAAAATAA